MKKLKSKLKYIFGDKLNLYIFSSVLLIKFLLIISVNNSPIFRDLFVTFANYSLINGLKEGYDHFYELGQYDIFPYSALMYYLFSLPKFIFRGGLIADHILYKLPMLFFDLAIYLVLNSLIKKNKKKITLFYWCSPILVYINFIHSQLDVIPIGLLFISLYFLLKKHWYISFIILGAAVSAKMNVIVAIPFYLIFQFNKQDNYIKIFLSLIITVITYFCINNVLIFSSSFQSLVLFNDVQSQVFDAVISIGNKYIYIIPFLYCYIVLLALRYKYYTKDLFVMLLGFTFSLFTLFIVPMPGWYYWIIPFIAYFYSKQQRYSKRLFIFLNLFYFTYFSKFSLDFINVNFSDLSFTFLQLFLVVNTLLIYRWGINSIINSKLNYIPYLIGIGGDSGVGKTTLSNSLLGIFGSMESLVIRGDDMHKWERGHEMWNSITHLSPKANKLHENFNHLFHLKNHKRIKRSFYDHNTGTFTNPSILKSKKIIIFEGLHPFYLKRNRELYDLKVFIEPEENLRLHWKILRDIDKRGYTKEKVLDQLKERELDSIQHIKPQAKYCDILITYYNRNRFIHIGDIDENVELALKVRLDNSIYIENIIEDLKSVLSIEITHLYEENYQEIDIFGTVSSSTIKDIFHKNIENIFDYIDIKSQFQSDYSGILQILLTHYIIMVTKGTEKRGILDVKSL